MWRNTLQPYAKKAVPLHFFVIFFDILTSFSSRSAIEAHRLMLGIIKALNASALPTHSRSSYLPSVERLFRGDPIIYIAPFYVLRLILKVGTFRAQSSECVPSHSFTLVFYPRGIGKGQGKEILKLVRLAHSFEDAAKPLQFRG